MIRTKSHVAAFITVATLIGGGTALLTIACSGNRQQDIHTAHDAVVLAKDACVLLQDVTPDGGAAAQVCATADELIPYINLVLAGRARAAARGDASTTIPGRSQ